MGMDDWISSWSRKRSALDAIGIIPFLCEMVKKVVHDFGVVVDSVCVVLHLVVHHTVHQIEGNDREAYL